MKITIKPWVLVTVGIAFNICSAVITHYFIDLNNQEIRLLENQINNIDTLIESQWRSKTQVDRKEEFLLSMFATVKMKDPALKNEIEGLIKNQLSELITQHSIINKDSSTPVIKDFGTIITISNQVKRKIINTINDTYQERLELDKQRQPLSENNALLSTLAIFLQVSGLILVLSRDFKA